MSSELQNHIFKHSGLCVIIPRSSHKKLSAAENSQNFFVRAKTCAPFPTHTNMHIRTLTVLFPCEGRAEIVYCFVSLNILLISKHTLSNLFLFCNNVHRSQPLPFFFTSKQTIAFVDKKRITAVKCLLLIIQRLYSYLM